MTVYVLDTTVFTHNVADFPMADVRVEAPT
jgi:hypothetical protein